MELTKQEATDFFTEFYGGEHHIPGNIKPFGLGWEVNDGRGNFATFDFSKLTKLVVLAHDKCIRVELNPVRNQIMQIAIWKRERTGGMSERHPTMEDAIIQIRQ